MEMIFNLASIFYWWGITERKKQEFNIDRDFENTQIVIHNYPVGNTFYVDKTGISQNILQETCTI